jgi:hypothetical protein
MIRESELQDEQALAANQLAVLNGKWMGMPGSRRPVLPRDLEREKRMIREHADKSRSEKAFDRAVSFTVPLICCKPCCRGFSSTLMLCLVCFLIGQGHDVMAMALSGDLGYDVSSVP